MNESVDVIWFGKRYSFRRGERMILACTAKSSVVLWAPHPPGTDHPLPRTRWIADRFIGGNVGFVEAKGDTPQEALDALAREWPFERLVAGGIA